MIYQEHEKTIYTPPGSSTAYDPLAIDRALTIKSSGTINSLLSDWCAGSDGKGDVSSGSVEANSLRVAQAEEVLVQISRAVFNLPPFPECLDATALEYLRHYLWWMEGKGQADGKPQ